MPNSILFDQIIKLSITLKKLNASLIYKKEITIHKLHVLHLCHMYNNISLRVLKEELILSSQSLSRLIAQLEKELYIERKFENKGDRRAIVISLTSFGEKTYREIKDNFIETFDNRILNADKKDIIATLDKSLSIFSKFYSINKLHAS